MEAVVVSIDLQFQLFERPVRHDARQGGGGRRGGHGRGVNTHKVVTSCEQGRIPRARGCATRPDRVAARLYSTATAPFRRRWRPTSSCVRKTRRQSTTPREPRSRPDRP